MTYHLRLVQVVEHDSLLSVWKALSDSLNRQHPMTLQRTRDGTV